MADNHNYRDIHSLPVEILSPIFCILSNMEPFIKFLRLRDPPPHRKLLWYGKPVLSVCRRWREVALGCPAFWSRIPITSLEWTKMALSHSDQTPIIVDMDNYHVAAFVHRTASVDAKALETALFELGRIKFLRLRRYGSLDALSYIRDVPAPLLEFFHFDGDRSSISLQGPQPVPIQLFGGEALPRLRDLHVEHYRLTGRSSLLRSHLSRLHLDNCGTVWRSLEDMTDTFSHMPGLRHLHLEEILPRTHEFPQFRQETPFNMASLADMHLQGPCLQVAAVMQSLIVPTHCRISLEIIVDDEQLVDCLAILKSELSDHLSRKLPSDGDFMQLLVHDEGKRETPCLRFCADKRILPIPGLTAYHSLDVNVKWAVPLGVRVACLDASGCVIPCIEEVVDLVVSDTILCWRRTLPNLFAEAKDVVKLSTYSLLLDGDDRKTFPVSSDVCPPDVEPRPSFESTFPQCQIISISTVNFRENLHPMKTSMADVLLHDIADEDLLRRCTVYVMDCDLSPDLVEKISELLDSGQLVWDGQSDGFTVFRNEVNAPL